MEPGFSNVGPGISNARLSTAPASSDGPTEELEFMRAFSHSALKKHQEGSGKELLPLLSVELRLSVKVFTATLCFSCTI